MSRVKFKEDTHQYFAGSEEYISVTTLIKRYAAVFDSKQWSTYKAIKDVMEWKNEWSAYKKEAGGWENAVQYWSNKPRYTDEILERKKYYLDMWEEEGRIAREKGSLAHAEKEAEIKGHVTTRTFSAGETLEIPLGTQEERIMDGDKESEGVYAEVLIWNSNFRVAGQVDKIIKRKNHIDIEDYKTNKQIKTEGFRGATMKYPLNELPDCNLSHYQMQLSLYAWMLQQKGYYIGTLKLIHIPNAQTEVPIEVEYRPDLVEKMLTHYAKRQIFS